MLESLAPASNICREISQLITILTWTVWGQSQNPIFILNTPLLHAGSPVCDAGWLDLIVWVQSPWFLWGLGLPGRQWKRRGLRVGLRLVGHQSWEVHDPYPQTPYPSNCVVTGMSYERKGSQFWLEIKVLVTEFSQLRTPNPGQKSIITGDGGGSSFLGEITVLF